MDLEKKITFDVLSPLLACLRFSNIPLAEINRISSYLYLYLSFYEENYQFSWEYKNRHSDGKRYLFSRENKSFAIGLIPRVYKELKEKFPNFKLDISQDVKNVFTPPGGKIDIEKVSDFANTLNIFNKIENVKITPYDFQIQLAHEAINNRRISLLAATGTGKSICVYIISRWLIEKEKKKVLIIVPSSGLVEQLKSDFQNDYGWDEIDKYCSTIHGQSKDAKLLKKHKNLLDEMNISESSLLKSVSIITWQTLQHKDADFFKSFNAIIIDECHGAKAEILQNILAYCKNADFKIGVSGTLEDEGISAALIEGSLGKKKVIIRAKEAIERGILTPIQIITMRMKYEEQCRRTLNRYDFDSQCTLLSCNGSKELMLKAIIDANQITTDQNTVLLFKELEPMNNMFEYIKANFPQFKAILYYGNVKANERELIRKQLEENSGYMVLATYKTMQQGINIKRLHNAIFVETSKSMIRVVQSIGRLTRKYKDKIVGRIFDFIDDCSYMTKPRSGNQPTLKLNYSLIHYNQRLKYYTDEGFPAIEYIAPFISNLNLEEYEKKLAVKENKKKETEVKKKKKPSKDPSGFDWE